MGKYKYTSRSALSLFQYISKPQASLLVLEVTILLSCPQISFPRSLGSLGAKLKLHLNAE